MPQHTATTPTEGTDFTALADEVASATAPAVTAAAAAYAIELHRAIVRRLSFKRPLEADDIASMAVENFLGLSPSEQHRIMALRPEAAVYGRIVTRHTAFDFDRTDRIQGCRGARLFDDGEGGKRAGRHWISGDARIGIDGSDSPSLFDLCQSSATGDIADDVAEHLSDLQRLEQALEGISPADRELLLRVDGNGEEVQQLAKEYGCTRETMSRRINRIRAVAKQNAERVKTGGMPNHTAHPAPNHHDMP